MSARDRFIVIDLADGSIADIRGRFANFTWRERHNGVGGWTAEARPVDLAELIPRRHAVAVLPRSEECVFVGIVENRQWRTVGGPEIHGYLQNRRMATNATGMTSGSWSSTTGQHTWSAGTRYTRVVADVVEHIDQNGNAIGLGANETAAGSTLTATYEVDVWSGTMAWAVISEMISFGVDVWVSYGLDSSNVPTFEVRVDQAGGRGQTLDTALNVRNAALVDYELAGQDFANHTTAVGATMGANDVRFAVDTEESGSSWPRWDQVLDFRRVSDETLLGEIAAAETDLAHRTRQALTLRLTGRTADSLIGDLRPGDTVSVGYRMPAQGLDLAGDWTAVSVANRLGDGGAEVTVTLTDGDPFDPLDLRKKRKGLVFV